MRLRDLVLLALAACLAATTACQRPSPAQVSSKVATSRPARQPTPAPPLPDLRPVGLAVSQVGKAVTLLGKAKLLHDPAAPLLSDQGAALISNGGGTLISDQGGGIISNNGGQLLGKAKRVVLQAPSATLGIYALADAEVRLFDAAGRLLVDEAGKPLAARTGPDGAYRLEAVLPPGNLIARVALWNGGELSAIVAREGAQQAEVQLSTASTLGAAYVLGLVKGEQATLDKLPRAEADRLVRELDAVRGWSRAAFKHEPATLEAVTARLRASIPSVERVAREVEALLLGQAKLGAGRPATEVPLGGPAAVFLTPEGRLVIGEHLSGRLRRLGADGTLTTLMDSQQGEIRFNILNLTDAIAAPDGTLYACGVDASQVFRIPPGQAPEAWLGSGEAGRDDAKPPLQMKVSPRRLALGPDGTLWVGEGDDTKGGVYSPPRLLGLRPDRTVTLHAPAWAGGALSGLAAGPDGAVWMLHRKEDGPTATLYRFKDGAFSAVGDPVAIDAWADVAVAPDGTVYVSSDASGTVKALPPTGSWATLDDLGPGNALGLQAPGPLCVGPDGTLYVADMGTNLVVERRPGQAPRVVAGTRAVFQSGAGSGFAINGPGGLAVDGDGRLLIAENGSHTVRAFDGQSLRTVAGSTRGLGGDGGDARASRLHGPRGLAWARGTLWIADANNGRLRRVGPDGRIETLVGGGEAEDLAPGTSLGGGVMTVRGIWGLATAPDGSPWWVNSLERQVLRLDPATGQVHHVAGESGKTDGIAGSLLAPAILDPARISFSSLTGLAFDAQGRCYVADTMAMTIYRLTPQPGGAVTIEPFAGRPARELLPDLEAYRQRGVPDDTGKPAREAVLLLPTGLAFDARGHAYVCEVGTASLEVLSVGFQDRLAFDVKLLPRSHARIRKIAPDGTITTIAGPGGRHFTNPTAEDALAAPTGIAVLPDGRLAIADTGTNLVRILPAGSY